MMVIVGDIHLRVNGEPVVLAVRGRLLPLPTLGRFAVPGKQFRHLYFEFLILRYSYSLLFICLPHFSRFIALTGGLASSVAIIQQLFIILVMKRIVVREGEPPLRSFLPPRRNKLVRMKDKVAAIAKTVLSYFTLYVNTNNGSLDVGAAVEVEPEELRDKKEKLLQKAVERRAMKFVSYHDIESSSDEGPEMPEVVIAFEKSSQPPQVQKSEFNSIKGKKEIVIYGQRIKEAQLREQANKLQVKLENKVIEKKDSVEESLEYSESGSDRQPESAMIRSEGQQARKSRKRKAERTTQTKNTLNPLSKYQISIPEQQKQFKDNPNPRKRSKPTEELYLGYLEDLSKKKMEIYQEVQQNLPAMMAQYKAKQDQVKQAREPEVNEDSDDPEAHLRNLKRKLERLKENRNKPKNERSPQYTCSQIVIKPKKVDFNVEKMLEIVKEKKIETPIGQFRTVEEGQCSAVVGSDEEGQLVQARPSSEVQKPNLFFNTGSPFFNPKKPEQDEKGSKAPSLFPVIREEPNEREGTITNIAMAPNTSVNSSLFVNLSRAATEEKQIVKPKEEKEREVEKKGETVAQVSKNSEPLTENPFKKSPGVVKDLLPTLIGNYTSNPLFGTKPSPVSSLFGLPTAPIPAAQQQKSEFSTPTKNILEKYPDMQANLPNPPIPESQEEESSMFDESEHSVSRRQAAVGIDPNMSPFGAQQRPAFPGSNWMQNPIIDGHNSFLSTMPNAHVQKSLELFGRQSPVNNSQFLWGNTSEEKKKPDAKSVNKKKSKQQRVYS